MPFFQPERYFSRISKIDIQKDLIDAGFEHVLLDIDNTILSRETHEIPRDARFWLSSARNAGIAFCLISNNWHANVYDLARELDLPIVAKALKPLPHAFLIGLHRLGAAHRNTVVVGDQLVTDVLGAHFAGLPAYLLQPLAEQDLKHTLLLRNVERFFMGNRQPEGVPEGAASVLSSAAVSAAASGATSASAFASGAVAGAAPAPASAAACSAAESGRTSL